ncbi:MAG: TIGR03663 family protein [Melioribacteraceae bacterium]|nr:TIGR03663 family protein [Melioribacteraceae bacterium]
MDSKNWAMFFIIAFIFCSALISRVYELDYRPMHVDEAVHAVKFGELLEKGFYKYDPIEYHGPALSYLSIIPTIFTGKTKFSELTEYDLRIIPVIAGMILLLLILTLLKEFDYKFILLLLFLTTFSSMNLFYNRYYIQESLLVSFSFSSIISLYHFYKSKNIFWLIGAGIFAGLAASSKETWIITFGAAIISLIILVRPKIKSITNIAVKNLDLFLVPFVVVVFLFYTSFLLNVSGINDFIGAFLNYFNKAGSFHEHNHAWYYYFSLVTFLNIEGFYFTEIIILILFLLGSLNIFIHWRETNKFIRFFLLFTVFNIIIYSAIPYKTPWTMMTFWQGIIIISAYSLFELNKVLRKEIWYVILAIFSLQQLYQAYQINYIYSFHPKNPFVYAHSTNDVKIIGSQIERIIGNDESSPLYITAPKDDYWSLPWYLRKIKNISWNDKINDDVYNFPIIISSPKFESELIEKLYSNPPAGEINLYVPLFDEYMELRPGVEIRGYIQKNILDRRRE